MLIGIPKEIKFAEGRVSVTPEGVEHLRKAGHKVLIQEGVGSALSEIHKEFSDAEYVKHGAVIVSSAKEAWDVDLVVKVKEPLESEYKFLNKQMLFTFLHLAANKKLTEVLIENDVIAIAYETVELPSGELPLLKPMSEIAGRLSVQAAARYLETPDESQSNSSAAVFCKKTSTNKLGITQGKLIGGAPGIAPASVVILGGGVVGTNAAKIAIGLGAKVTVFDIDINKLRYLDDLFDDRLNTLYAHKEDISYHITTADIVIGAVLICGAKAPRLITNYDILCMKPGSVVVDVAIDQGGCIATAKPAMSAYLERDIIHYCPPNFPGMVPYTSTLALTNVTLPYIKALGTGLAHAMVNVPGFKRGINVMNRNICCKAVAEVFNSEPQEDSILIRPK